MPAVLKDKEDSDSPSEDDPEDHPCITWSGLSKTIPVFLFVPEAAVTKDGSICSIGERYHMAFKIVRTESRLVRGILTNHGFHEVHPNSTDFNLMWTGSHLKPYILRTLQDFQKVNHFPRSYELTRKDRLYKNIQRMQQTHGFKNFHIVPQTFMLPSEYQEFCNSFAKDKGPWIIKPVASSRGRGIYLVSSPSQISMDENILVSRYINNPLLIDEFKFDMRLYVLVTSYDPLLIYVYEEGLARFATVKYDRTPKSIKNTFMHLTNYSLNKKSSDYVSCDDPEVEDYGNKWSMSAVLRYLKQEGKDTTLLMRQVEDLIIKALLSAELEIAAACKMFVPHKTNCFELYGFDVLVDANLKPWLLEVNLSPSLACDAPLDLKIKASMIADMLSLVGFVCQDPIARHPRPDRVTLDRSLKHSAAHRIQRQRPASASNPERVESKDKLGHKQGQGDNTLTLTAEEIKVLRRIKEEYERRGGFVRVFPSAETWELYSGYLESKTSMNYMLANRLFHGRNVNGNVQLQVDAVRGCHVGQYERKLPSLEARKKRQRHPTHRVAAGKKKSGKESKTSLTMSSSQEGEEVKQLLEPVSHRALIAELRKQVTAPPGRCHDEVLSKSEAATHNAGPRVDLLNILQQGWDLSKVQARMAFSSYLLRVQQRLLAESRAKTIPALPDKDNDQMDLVIRFLRRAASNLQQDMKVVSPSHELPLKDRRRILSQKLGEFIDCYNKDTEHMVKTQGESKDQHCISPTVFQEYIAAASENDLEEVLTFYTQKNKSATVFLGTKHRGVKKGHHGANLLGNSGNCETSKSLPGAKKDSAVSESSLSPGKVISDPDIRATSRQSSGDQQAPIRIGKTQLEIQSSQHCSSFPVTLDSTHPRHPSSTSTPLQCPPPPAQPPSYAQSLAKSHFCHAQTLSDPPAYTSASMASQPASTGSSRVPVGEPTQLLRRIQSFTLSTHSSGASSSIPSATQIYSQKLSRPTSASQVARSSSTGKLKSNSVGTFQELSARAQSNQQAFISALQKLADKQDARSYASSSHINLLTQHLTNMNLANRILGRESLTPNSKVRHPACSTQGPMRAAHAGTDLCDGASLKPVTGEEGLWDGKMKSADNLERGANRQQRQQPTHDSYQLQFAIQRLQQQRFQSLPFLDQSHCRHQVPFSEQTTTPPTPAPTHSFSCPPPGLQVRPNQCHGQSLVQPCGGPVLTPKPPNSAREGQMRKTAAKRLIRQKSSESPVGGSAPGSQHAVCEAICGKSGLPAYPKLSRGQDSSRR
ncbi:tubulin polyglutamylase TTLL5 [Brachionichthys hirsutus]|uniref:tubulin polyglutamylase TTLL5 n=1 Tax=Brachionichthys hirsutus TaxID=412623 RepID=UPI003604975F